MVRAKSSIFLYGQWIWYRAFGPEHWFYVGGCIGIWSIDRCKTIWNVIQSFDTYIKILLVFAEHRYYGKSMPFGNKSFDSPSHTGYLNSQQALADFADLLINKLNSNGRPVIAFGGSYSGNLAVWMRMKYPHIIDGAIASSSAILPYTGQCDDFVRTATSVFEATNHNCTANIQKSWTYLTWVLSLFNRDN